MDVECGGHAAAVHPTKSGGMAAALHKMSLLGREPGEPRYTMWDGFSNPSAAATAAALSGG